jgi:hypothetical protein
MDAATTRIKTRELDDWQEDMFWMVMYFSFAAWSGLLMMVTPPGANASNCRYQLVVVMDAAGASADSRQRRRHCIPDRRSKVP